MGSDDVVMKLVCRSGRASRVFFRLVSSHFSSDRRSASSSLRSYMGSLLNCRHSDRAAGVLRPDRNAAIVFGQWDLDEAEDRLACLWALPPTYRSRTSA